jgi:hypothetical protein
MKKRMLMALAGVVVAFALPGGVMFASWQVDHATQVAVGQNLPELGQEIESALRLSDGNARVTSELAVTRHRGMTETQRWNVGESRPHRWGVYREIIDRQMVAGELVSSYARIYDNHLTDGPSLVRTPFHPALTGDFQSECVQRTSDGLMDDVYRSSGKTLWELSVIGENLGELGVSYHGLSLTVDVYRRLVAAGCGMDGGLVSQPVQVLVGWNQSVPLSIPLNQYRVSLIVNRRVNAWVP